MNRRETVPQLVGARAGKRGHQRVLNSAHDANVPDDDPSNLGNPRGRPPNGTEPSSRVRRPPHGVSVGDVHSLEGTHTARKVLHGTPTHAPLPSIAAARSPTPAPFDISATRPTTTTQDRRDPHPASTHRRISHDMPPGSVDPNVA